MSQRNIPTNRSTLEVEIIDYVLPKPNLLERLLGVIPDPTLENAQRNLIKDQCNATLTMSVLQHISTLSQMQQDIEFCAPQAKNICRAIVNAYGIEAIKLITGGGDLPWEK